MRPAPKAQLRELDSKHTSRRIWAATDIARWCCALLLGTFVMSAVDARKSQANGSAVDLALVLGIDISRSVNSSEFQLQRGGLAYAIRRPDVVAAIKSGSLKRIAVTVVQWSDYEAQVVVVPWMSTSI